MFGFFRLWAFAALALLASNVVDQAAAEQRLSQRSATTTVPVPVPVPQVTPQFNNPAATFGNPDFGIVSSAGSPVTLQRTPRQIQFGLKFYF